MKKRKDERGERGKVCLKSRMKGIKEGGKRKKEEEGKLKVAVRRKEGTMSNKKN